MLILPSTVLLIVSLTVLLYIFFSVQGYNIDKTIIIVCLSSLALLCYTFNTRRISEIRGKVLRPSLLLLFGMCIIVFQNLIDLWIGNTDTDATVFYNKSLITMGVAYGAIAIIAYIIGYTSTKNRLPESIVNSEEKKPLNFLVLLSVIFSLIFISTIDAGFFSGQSYVDSGNIGESHTNNSEVLLGICNAAILIQYAINNRGRQLSFREYIWHLPKIFLLIFFGYIILVLIRGTRFFALRDILILVFSYIYTCRKQPMRNVVLVILCALASVMLTVISFSRAIVTDDLSAKYRLGMEGFENRKSFSPTTLELANSQFCDMSALNIFENNGEQHLLGSIQARYLAVIAIPNRLLQKIWTVPVEQQGSAYFLTAREIGLDAEMGLGSTVYTDFYIDFGIIGMIFCMILLGILFKKMDLMLYSNPNISYSIFAIVMLIYISACAFYLSRSAFIPTLRMPLYTYILIKLNSFFSKTNS